MADTKQATTETVCECGHTISDHGGGLHGCRVPNGNCGCVYFRPRTQPNQTELRIPDDLKKRYEYCMDTKGLYDFPNGSVAELIERIARLEGRSVGPMVRLMSFLNANLVRVLIGGARN